MGPESPPSQGSPNRADDPTRPGAADRLASEGWRASVLADDNGLVDREAAYRAGLREHASWAARRLGRVDLVEAPTPT